MAGISNVSSSINSNDKMVSKLTFEVGENFEAKIENIDSQNGEAVLRTKDGWRFLAKLENPVEFGKDVFSNFVVQGYENGELNIKLIPSDDNKSTSENGIIEILKQYSDAGGEDINLLKALVEHNIPLTKENISGIKTLMEFRRSIMDNPSKEDEFIQSYLNSKGIDKNSEKGIEIKNVLKDFFTNLKGIDLDEVTIFKENEIEFTGENIKSFNNIFKGDSAIYKTLKEISNAIMSEKSESTDEVNSANSQVKAGNDLEANNIISEASQNMAGSQNVVSDVGFKDIDKENIQTKTEQENVQVSSKTISEFKKSVINNETRQSAFIDAYLKNNGISENSIKGKQLKADFKELFTELKEADVPEIKNLLQNGIETKGFNLTSIKELINSTAENQDEVSDGVFKDINNDNIQTKTEQENVQVSSKTISEFKKSVINNETRQSAFIDAYLKNNGISENSIKGKQLKADFKELFTELKEIDVPEIKNLLQNGVEAKGFNLGSIKELIKEDPTAFDEFKKVMYSLEKMNEASNDKQQEDIKNSKEGILKAQIGNNEANDIVSKKGVNSMAKNFDLGKLVHNEINSKINEMKKIITDIIKENNADSPAFGKVMSALNNNINDFKIFNSMSNEYYYVDVPVNFQTNEYNCKLIIKDDRKSGKKLDSKNIKIVLSIKTVNMGTIDAFLNVKNNNMRVDIKADDKFTRILDASKKFLISRISDKGYIIDLRIKEKEQKEQLNLVNCRKFFNDDTIVSVDTRV